jgi:hypothetical protein
MLLLTPASKPLLVLAVSPEGGSDYAADYADETQEGPSPQMDAPRAFSSHELQRMEMAAAMESGREGGGALLAGDSGELEVTQAHAAASAAAVRLHGLRDDAPGN